MNAVFEQKNVIIKALDISTETRQVKIAFAQMGSVDSDNDVFDTSAFTKTIKEQGPQGANRIWHLADHQARLNSAFGKFSEVGIQGNYLYGVSQYKDSSIWRDAWPLYEKGDITEHSIGFYTNSSIKGSQGERIITQATVFEGSAVMWGANSNTPTLDVIKSLTKTEQLDHFNKKFTSLINAIKMGKFEEDNSLMILELKQIQQSVIDLNKESTQPSHGVTSPEIQDKTGELLLDIKQFTKSLFS